jgi:radical SAM peptide maturase (CXXX-repeat target family)
MIKRNEYFNETIQRLFPFEAEDGRLPGRTVIFQVTDGCNLRCSYCYQTNKGTHVMPLETAKKFIDLLLSDKYDYINTKNVSSLIVEFIGGEPFLAVDVMDGITDYFITQMALKHHPWAARFRISVSSNGTLYFEPGVQEYIKKYRDFLSLGITVDGCKTLHDACRVFPDGSGSYDLASGAMSHYCDAYGGEKKSKITISPDNLAFTKDAVLGLIEEGYTRVNLNCIFEDIWEPAHAPVLYTQLKALADALLAGGLYETVYVSMFEETTGCPMQPEELTNWCGGLGHMLALDWKGDIYPCIRYMESSLGEGVPPVIIGNVDTGLLSTEAQRNIVAQMKSVTRRTQSDDECFYCPIAFGCGYCSAYNYQQTGSFNKRSKSLCRMHRARALACVYYFNKVFRATGENKRFMNHVPEEWALELIGREELDALNALARP